VGGFSLGGLIFQVGEGDFAQGFGGPVPSLTLGVQAGFGVVRNEASCRGVSFGIIGRQARATRFGAVVGSAYGLVLVLGQGFGLAVFSLFVAALVIGSAFLLDFEEGCLELDDLAVEAVGLAAEQVEVLSVF